MVTSADVNHSLFILENAIKHKAIFTKNVNQSYRLGQHVLHIADRLLSNDTLASWNILEKNVNKTPEILLNQVEEIITSLGKSSKVNETIILNSTNFAARLEIVSPHNFHERSYSITGLDIQKDSTTSRSGKAVQVQNVFIPASLVESVNGNEPFSLNLLKYKPSSTIIKPKLDENRISRASLGSDIVAISLSRPLKRQLKEDVVMTFPPAKASSETAGTTCRFLNFHASSETTWSKRGCKLTMGAERSVICSCNHFTHFAVLLEFENHQVDPNHSEALSWITYLGCGISLVCLIVTLITLVFVKTLSSDHTVIHCNLVVSLTLAQIVFLFGIRETQTKIACKIIAIILHYLYTAAICWMGVEGIHLYRKVVKVFMKSNGKKYYYILGWGAPAVVVSLSALTRLDGYGNETACWLSIESGLIWAFVAPVLGVILVNLIILSLVIRVMLVAVNSTQTKSESSNVRAGVKGIIFLLPILGLTWVFGILAVNKATAFFQYMFTILNSFQGFFIFMFHCVMNSEVQAAVKRHQERSSLQRSVNDSYARSKDHKANYPSKTRSSMKHSFTITGVRPSPRLEA